MAPTASQPRGHAVPQEVFDVYLLLHEGWPEVFNLQRPKPLAIGIDKTLQAEVSVSPEMLKQCLRWYTRRWPYHEAMLKATHRCGLDGQPQDAISDQERQFARVRLGGKSAQKAAPAARVKATPAKPAQPAPGAIWAELKQYKEGLDMLTEINATLKLVLRETPEMGESEDKSVLYCALQNTPKGMPAWAHLPESRLYLALPAKLWRNAQKKGKQIAEEGAPVWWMIEGAVGMSEEGLLVYAKSVQAIAGKEAKAA